MFTILPDSHLSLSILLVSNCHSSHPNQPATFLGIRRQVVFLKSHIYFVKSIVINLFYNNIVDIWYLSSSSERVVLYQGLGEFWSVSWRQEKCALAIKPNNLKLVGLVSTWQKSKIKTTATEVSKRRILTKCFLRDRFLTSLQKRLSIR